MVSDVPSTAQSVPTSTPLPILHGKLVKSCHIRVPDLPKPVGAIAHEGKFYSYFRCYQDVASAQRAATRLVARGDLILLTQVRRGLILWVFEPEAQLARH